MPTSLRDLLPGGPVPAAHHHRRHQAPPRRRRISTATIPTRPPTSKSAGGTPRRVRWSTAASPRPRPGTSSRRRTARSRAPRSQHTRSCSSMRSFGPNTLKVYHRSTGLLPRSWRRSRISCVTRTAEPQKPSASPPPRPMPIWRASAAGATSTICMAQWHMLWDRMGIGAEWIEERFGRVPRCLPTPSWRIRCFTSNKTRSNTDIIVLQCLSFCISPFL